MRELPKFAEFSDPNPDLTPDKTAEEVAWSRRKFLHFGKNALIATGISLAGIKTGLDTDQKIGDQIIWRSEGAKLHEIPNRSPETYDESHATFVFGGFGIKNSTNIAKVLSPSLGKNGRLYGIEYDNAGISIPGLAAKISDRVAEQGLKTINLYGHSMGGDVALLVVDELLEHSSELNVPHIMLDCTPSGINAVHDSRVGSGETWSGLQSKLGIYGGPLTRLSVELYNSPRRSEFLKPIGQPPFVDASYLLERAKDLASRKLVSGTASNRLLIDQFNIIRSLAVDSAIENISLHVARHGLISPRLTGLRPKLFSDDAIVQNDISEIDFRAACEKYNLDFSTIYLTSENIRHADPRAFKAEYNHVLAELLA